MCVACLPGTTELGDVGVGWKARLSWMRCQIRTAALAIAAAVWTWQRGQAPRGRRGRRAGPRHYVIEAAR